MRLKHFALVSTLFVSAMACGVSRADTLTLKGAGPNVGGEDIYPYSFSLNGSSSYISMMCIDFNREVTFGETWQVNEQGIPTDKSTLSQDYRADAWIFSQMGKSAPAGGTYTTAEIQYAVWDILDPSGVSGNSGFDDNASYLATQAMRKANNSSLLDSGFFNNFDLFVPTSDSTGWTAGVPQRYIVDSAAVTPEPSSLLLMGTGLIGCALLLLRRRNPVGVTAV